RRGAAPHLVQRNIQLYNLACGKALLNVPVCRHAYNRYAVETLFRLPQQDDETDIADVEAPRVSLFDLHASLWRVAAQFQILISPAAAASRDTPKASCRRRRRSHLCRAHRPESRSG